MAAVLLAAAAPAPVHADPLAGIEARQQALFDRLAPSVVYLSTGDGIGSGFFVSRDGLVLTNTHVVGDHDKVDVVLHDGRKVEGVVVERAEGVDLALVRLPLKDTPAVKLGSPRLRVGSWIGSIGHGLGGAWTFTTGMVTNIYPLDGERPVFQTQIPLNPGNSGGPVFDREGQVVGVVTASIKGASVINFAIRIELAVQLLHLLGGNAGLVIEAPEGAPVFVGGKLAGHGPRIVVPVSEGRHSVRAVVGGTMKEREIEWPAERVVRFEP